MTDQQRKQAAAAIFTAAAEGKECQFNYMRKGWDRIDPFPFAQNVVDKPHLYRIRPWSLPAPPEGKEWHRTDGWTEEMLPIIDGKQTRPLMWREKRESTDEVYENRRWRRYGNGIDIPYPAAEREGYHSRTTRPLPTEPKVRAWNKPEDVPGPVCWIRSTIGAFFGQTFRNSDPDAMHAMILSASLTGISYASKELQFIPWGDPKFARLEHSTDRLTWKKCEVTE